MQVFFIRFNRLFLTIAHSVNSKVFSTSNGSKTSAFANFAQNHFVTKNSNKWREIQISEILHSPLSPGGRGAVVSID